MSTWPLVPFQVILRPSGSFFGYLSGRPAARTILSSLKESEAKTTAATSDADIIIIGKKGGVTGNQNVAGQGGVDPLYPPLNPTPVSNPTPALTPGSSTGGSGRGRFHLIGRRVARRRSRSRGCAFSTAWSTRRWRSCPRAGRAAGR